MVFGLFVVVLVVKVICGFIVLIQLVRLLVDPGFGQMYLDGEKYGKNILTYNLLLLIIPALIFYIISKCGINFIQ